MKGNRGAALLLALSLFLQYAAFAEETLIPSDTLIVSEDTAAPSYTPAANTEAPTLRQTIEAADTPAATEVETSGLTNTDEPTATPTYTPTPTPTATATIETTPSAAPSSSPSPTETEAPTATPSPTPATEPPLLGIAPPEPQPLPLPTVQGVSLIAMQDEEWTAKVHIAIERVTGDERPVELIHLLVEDDSVHTVDEYFSKYPLKADAFAPENLLKVDSSDEKKRYIADIPYGMRFIVLGRVEGELFHSDIFPAYLLELPQEPTDTKRPPSDGEVYITPKDDDGDGLYSRTEYRLGLDPHMKDTNGEGDGDFLSIYLQGRLGKEGATTLFNVDNPAAWQASAEAGLLGQPVTAENHDWVLRKFERNWTSGGPALVGSVDKCNARMVCINNHGIFVANFQHGRQLEIERAMYLSVIDYPALNKHRFARNFDVTADGKMVLLYDRTITEESGKGGGTLRADAMLIDTGSMVAYPVMNSAGAKDIALSLDGTLLAIWQENELAIWNLTTGSKAIMVERSELARMEMLSFAQDNLLVVRVTQMGYSAVRADGSLALGNSDELGVFIRSRDMLGFDVYDKDHLPMRVDAKLFLASNGIAVSGEDGKARRVLSHTTLYECFSAKQ